jgi:RNA polymerase sigma-70 factor (ECF subfamily)
MTLDHAFEIGRRTWPAATLTLEAFAEYVQSRELDSDTVCERAADIFLALACAAGDPGALSDFEQNFLTQVPRQLGRLVLQPHQVDELKQRLRVRLLVGPTARIREYSATGPLGAWVRVCAGRIALDLLAAPEERKGDDSRVLDALVASVPAADAAVALREHDQVFRKALSDALAALETRDRTLLRLHYLDNMNIDILGTIYQVHRATVARWLKAIRTNVLKHVRLHLKATLGASASEVKSLVQMLGDNGGFSVACHLASGSQAG